MQIRIRDLSEDRTLTQKQIADILHCERLLYAKYERGERSLAWEHAMQLADFYQVSFDYLAGRIENKGS